MWCSSCDITEEGHYTEHGTTLICKYQVIREVLWVAKITNEEGERV